MICLFVCLFAMHKSFLKWKSWGWLRSVYLETIRELIGIPYRYGDTELYDLFRECGEIAHCNVPCSLRALYAR